MNETGGDEITEYRRALEVLSLLSGKWDPIVVLTIRSDGPLGFNEALEAIPDISGKVLSETLESLEENGIIDRRVVNDAPLRVEYDLTEAGRELESVFDALAAWGSRHLDSARPTVLVAGGDRRLTDMYDQWLSARYDVDRVHDVAELESTDLVEVDVVLVGDDLPGARLPRLLESIRSHCRTVLLVSDLVGIDLFEVPCDGVLRKPIVRSAILEAVDEQLARQGEPDDDREQGALAAKRSVLDAVRPSDGAARLGKSAVEDRSDVDSL